MRLFKQDIAQNRSAMDRMVTTYAMGGCVWESAGLETEGKVYSLVPGNLAAAETAKKYWEEVVNIYHKEVKENATELASWPFRGGSPHQMCKDAVSAAFRAHSAIERVKRGQ
jgi:hypothetical protein